MRGRKPTPTALKELRGNPGKRALPKNEPRQQKVGPPPDDLCQEAKIKWFELIDVGAWGLVVSRSDREMLAEYCRLSARKAKAEEKVAEHGEIVASPNGFPVQSPWLQILNKCRADMHKIQIEFGGSPSSRTRVSVEDDSEEEDPTDRFFN